MRMMLRRLTRTRALRAAAQLSTNLSGREAYKKSLEDPVAFWNAAASAVTWENFVPHRSIKADDPLDTWFPGSSLNFCLNCVDIHVKEGRGEQTALIYDSPVTKTITSVTYNELLSRVEVCSAVMLQNMGVKKGDRIIIYMPNVIEAIVTMLACYRIGAVHSVVFGGFAPHELATRLRDCKPTAIVLSSCGIDGSKIIPYAPLVQRAIEIAENTSVQSVLVHQRLQHPVDASMMHALGAVGGVRQVLDWEDTMTKVACSHSTDDIKKLTAPVAVDASHPLFILYTSGTTGAPKGVVRDTGGYAVGLKYSLSVVNGTRPGDVFWGASDVGWIVGHYSYLGSLITGATSVVYEGKPVGTPDEGNFWRTIERHKVNLLFTAPTALRAIKKLDDQGEQSKKFDLSSLKSIFCSGEHLDPDTLRWAERVSGKPVLDAWWQTESGSPMTGPLVGLDGYKAKVKPGSAFHAVPGYNLMILDHDGKEKTRGEMGFLVSKLPMPPGFMSGIYNNRQRFETSYLSKFRGYYDTGDAGVVDEEGYVFIMSRVDDVINVAGHRFSTGQMEECLSEMQEVAEVAVVGIKDSFKGQLPLGLCVLNASAQKAGVTEAHVAAKGAALIRERIGAVACFSPKSLLVVDALPKTRSGKVLRGTLRSIANHEEYKVPATIEDAGVLKVLEKLILDHGKHKRQ